MQSYQGPATVVCSNIEVSVEADLSVEQEGGLKSWAGSLQAEVPGEAYDVYQDENAVLRVGNREGRFVCKRADPGTGEMEIAGSGPAPF